MINGVPFADTLRAVDRGMGLGHQLLLALTVGLLGTGAAWSVLGEVSLYEASDDGRIEVLGAAHHVDSTATGRIREVLVSLGDTVDAGQALVELDDRAPRLELDALAARVTAVDAQLAPLRVALGLETRALALDDALTEAAQAELGALRRARTTRARLARKEAERALALQARGVVAGVEQEQASGIAAVSAAEAEASRQTLRKQQWQGELQRLDHARRCEELRERIAVLEGQRAALLADIAVVELELELLTVVAPVSGRVASVSALTPGAHVEEGAELLSIVPEQPLQVVAYFDPASAVGRIRPGQPTTIRLQGFPWLQYGTMAATVASVSSEPSERGMRVLFAVVEGTSLAARLEHGLAARLEVEVETVAPAELVLRAAGQWLVGDAS